MAMGGGLHKCTDGTWGNPAKGRQPKAHRIYSKNKEANINISNWSTEEHMFQTDWGKLILFQRGGVSCSITTQKQLRVIHKLTSS